MMYLNTAQVTDKIFYAMATGSRLSVVRMGDGDGIFIGYPTHFSRAELDHVLWYMFGHSAFSDAEIGIMQDMVRLAYATADIIGIAKPGTKGERWDRTWAMAEEMGYLEGRKLCDVDVAINMQRNPQTPYFRDVFYHARTVCLVTCRDVVKQLAGRFPYLESIVWIETPHEHQAEPGREYTEQHWPHGYQRVHREIAQRPADLYLVGAGSLGKSYTHHAAMLHNCVAFDIGSVFDGWAGLTSSRSHLRNEPEAFAL